MATTVWEYDEKKLHSMHQAVGEAITAFASVEIGLDYLFASLMRPANRQKANAVLKAARHIETKMRIVKAAGDQHAWKRKAQKAEFNSLLNRLKNRADTRNKVAHWMIVYMGEGPLYRGFPIQLLPSNALTEPLSEHRNGLTMKQVREFTDKCRGLTRDLFAFSANELAPKARSKKA
jgi:hypothetical protein